MLQKLIADIKFAVLANKVEKCLNATCTAYAHMCSIGATTGTNVVTASIKAAGKHQAEIQGIAKDVQCALDHIDMAMKQGHALALNIADDPAVRAAWTAFVHDLEQNQEDSTKEITKAVNSLMKLFG